MYKDDEFEEKREISFLADVQSGDVGPSKSEEV
jgi:hypothetical protein